MGFFKKDFSSSQYQEKGRRNSSEDKKEQKLNLSSLAKNMTKNYCDNNFAIIIPPMEQYRLFHQFCLLETLI